MTSACHLVGSDPLVSLLMLTMSSEVRERGKARHCQREPMMAANDWRKFYRQDGQMNVFDNAFLVQKHVYNRMNK